MSVSDFILRELADAGVGHAFTVYGGAISELMDAFTRTDKIAYVCTQHEQAAGFAAEAYAKLRGIGCAIATSGPGGGNLVTPIMNCYYDSVPVVFITGNVNSKFARPSDRLRQLGFQEAPISDIVRPITKFAGYCSDREAALNMLPHAIKICRSGRPGPVLLDIPIDVQKR